MKVVKFIGKVLGFIILAIVIFFAIVYGLIAYQTSRTQISYQDEIYEYSEKYNIDPLLTASIIKVESDFDNKAQSHQGAHGLMQLLEDTAKHSADVVGIDYYPEKLNDVDYNLDLGVGYFDYLYRYYNNRDLALAAYNGGVGNVDSWIKEGTLDKDNPDPLKIPFEETRQYVTKVNANYEVMKKFYKDGLPSEEEISDLRSLSLRNFEIFIKDFIRNIR
ncbi:MAG: lytic transglycosylase domain-containing protein [Anaerococcus sp.]|uniref:lytic transglycosylase domain-containing protein n=1 Tax=Anaerococcus sp. TaxID=1872515 RepID=UPI002636F537|nr:lytic transglycosylase domain-containing protein [Anaerococcus sp.]MCI5972067.1 lytic transglycosylase domain-containing protein [Anaerococcus sp.]MDD6918611.1 lytic transglycosylase domain-containing protein [Peptoniphilaceae bacterium]MDY2927272.1 lytic transglycosylase domain-containing protein [Anaerococcus sp.]